MKWCLLVGGVQLAVADVVANGAVEQPRVLQHHAEQAAQIVAREIADVRAADLDAARLHVVEAHEQLDHGGLAGARGADQRDGLAFRHLGREVLDHRLLRIVAEAHVVELHVALHVGGTGGRMVGLLLGRVEELKDALGGRGHLLQHVGHLRELGDGLREVLHVLDERLDVAHRDDALHGQEAAGDGDGHVAQVADERHDRLHEAAEELRLPRRPCRPRG